MKTLIIIISILFVMSARAQVRLTFHWRQISGPIATIIDHPDSANTLVRELNVPGDYDYELEVCNDFGCRQDTARITVRPEKTLAIDTTSSITIPRPRIKKLEIRWLEKPSEIWLEIKSPRVQTLKMQLYNSLGQMLATAEIPVKHGVNYASLPRPQLHGVYYIRVLSYFENITKKIII